MEVKHEADEHEARLADVISLVRDTIRRRWLVLLGVTVLVFALGLAGMSLMTPRYSATAKVRLDPTRNPLASGNAQQTHNDLSDEAIQTEVTAVRSLDVAREIVRQNDLVADPEFNGALTKPGATPLTTTDARETVVANELLKNVTVSRERETYILDVSVTSTDPIKAARLANAFAKGYIGSRTHARMDTARQQNEWFQEQLNSLGRDATNAEAHASEFRARAGILGSTNDAGGGGTIIDQQVAPLSGSLAQAQSDAAAARASLNAAQQQIARGNLDTVSEVLNSGVVADLRRQRAEVLRNQGEVEAHYGDRHPETIRVNQQLASLNAQILAEAQRIAGSLRANAAATQARVDSLSGSLNQLEHDRERSVQAASVADGLQHEADAKRALYDKMSQLSLDSMQNSSAQFALAEVVAVAQPPVSPSSPNKPLLLAIALLLGLVAAVAVVTAQEMLSGGFRTVEGLEAELGLPVLAVVPKVAKSQSPSELMLEKPTSMFSESFRIARTAVLGARGEAGMKVIAITSSLPAEGKTTSAVAFARTLAIANARVLLLECDVRRAAVRHITRGNPPQLGIVELLHGEISLDQAIQSGDVPNLDWILVTSPYFSAENLFGEGRMEQLLAALRARYDYIVLDLPPLMGLADGRYLSALADATALVVKWRSTPISAASAAVSWLRNDGAKPIGVLYTQVDPSTQAAGGLYYYSKQYSEYYEGA